MQMKKIKISLIFITILCISINAQVILPPPELPTLDSGSVQNYDYIFVIIIGADSKLTLNVQNTEKSDSIGTISDMSSLLDFLSKSTSKKDKTDPLIIIKADPSLNFGSVVDVIRKIRKLNPNKIKVKMSENLADPYVLIPDEPLKDNSNVKPNPLTLVVDISSDRKVRLNNDNAGDLYNSDALTTYLEKIFKERGEYGVFREGTSTVERTVFIKASRSLRFSEVIRLTETVKRTGATPVGLQIDNLN